jgi:hypothetical protein
MALASTILTASTMAACASGASPATPTPTVAPPVASPLASAGPSHGPAGPSTSPAGDLGAGGNGELVIPKPGQLDVHPISADSFEARLDGRRVVVIVTYTSGVEPCSVLDSIVVQRGVGSFAVTLREGHAAGNQVCIMIAKVMKTKVDLGELDPGTYTISDATGGAAAIQVVVT